MTTRRPVEVAIAVIRDGDHVWVQQRRERGALDGCWEFPGGRPLAGEPAAAAAAREAHEETGAHVVVGDLLDDRLHDYEDRTVRLRFFAATLAGDSPAPTGGRWVPVTALASLAMPAANGPVCARLAGPDERVG